MNFLHPDQLTVECKQMASDFERYIQSIKPGATIEVHSDWDLPGSHSAESQHYSGNAIDLHVNGMGLLEQWIAASRVMSVRGLGGYPFWHSRGLHLDCRPVATRALWWKNGDKKYDRPMTEFFKLVTF